MTSSIESNASMCVLTGKPNSRKRLQTMCRVIGHVGQIVGQEAVAETAQLARSRLLRVEQLERAGREVARVRVRLLAAFGSLRD